MVWKTIGLTDPMTTGDEVREAQGLLRKNPFEDFRPGTIDGLYGPITAHATQSAKFALGMADEAVNNLFGPHLHDYLSGAAKLPAENAKRREERLQARVVPDVRAEMVKWCLWGIENEAQIHYEKARPIPTLEPGTLPLSTDCSGSTIIFAQWAGVPPHPGIEYQGAGSSTNMAGLLRQVSREDVEPGDLVVWSGFHVSVLIEVGADPMVMSHGEEAGPLKMRLDSEIAGNSEHGQPKFYSLLESA